MHVHATAKHQFIHICISITIILPTILATFTALPPGYEDKILCHPSTACLRPFPRQRGWCGPRTAFVECCDAETGEVSRPRGWGVKLDAGYLDELLLQGWGVAMKCDVDEAERCGGNKNLKKRVDYGELLMMAKMEGVVDRLLGLEVYGLW